MPKKRKTKPSVLTETEGYFALITQTREAEDTDPHLEPKDPKYGLGYMQGRGAA